MFVMTIGDIVDPKGWFEYVNENDAVLLYLHNDRCGVCNTLHPKVISLVDEKFPKITLVNLDAELNRELAAQIRMMSIPGIILYMAGKEVFRANGMIAISDLERMIARPYSIMFE
jgi:thioredoxin-like negative regulator of GroEL